MKTGTKYLLIAILAFIAGAAFEYWLLTDIWPNRHLTYTWVYTLRNHRKPGAPCETDQVLDRQGYSLGYSYQYTSALWVSYILSSGSVSVNIGRHGSFYADTDIPEKYRVQPEQHLNIGYDKGHLAPSASIDFSKTANRETFALSNVVPQNPKLNRQAWEKLESLERKWAKTNGKLYVVTGPIYSSSPKKVNGIPIPSKFYKVIYAYKTGETIGFIMPNAPIPDRYMWKYAMSVKEVEEQTRLIFFSNFSKKKQQTLKEHIDLEGWKGEDEIIS